MNIDEDYYNSEDFQELLNSYEESVASGQPMFLDADDIVDLADYYTLNDEDDKAEAAIEHGLTLYPDDVLFNVFIARRALAAEDYEEARRVAERIGDKESPDYHYLLAEILIAQKQIDEADQYLRNIYKTVPPDEVQDYIKDVANLYIDYNVSDKAYEWMLRSPGDNSDDFKELMARTLFGLGKYKDSQRLFNELIDSNPYSKHYWTALAAVQFMDEDYSASITSSEYAIAIDPDDPEGLMSKANGLLKLENYEEAIETFEKIVKLVQPIHDDETLVHVYQEMAYAYCSLGQIEQALAMIDKTDSLPCNHVDMLIMRGHLYLSLQNIEKAEVFFKRAMIESDGDPDVVLRIIFSLYDNRYVNACYMLLKRLLASRAYRSYNRGYAYMVLCCYELGRDEECLLYLKKAVERNPSETQAVLSHLFPEGLPVEDYYKYLKREFELGNL